MSVKILILKLQKPLRIVDIFIALLSKNTAHGDNVHTEFNFALEVLGEFPEGDVFILPIRLDNCEIPYEKLREKQTADLFPNRKAGMEMVLKSLGVANEKINDVLENPSFQEPSIPPTSKETVREPQAVSTSSVLPGLFKGEKKFFVGRHEYIDKLIKSRLIKPGSRVSIVGPGGLGKSQLAFKALHRYKQEGIFDAVIPIYFDLNIKPPKS